MTNITVTTKHVHDGGAALAVSGLSNGEVVSVALPICKGDTVNLAGFTMTAWVYLTGTPLSTESFLFFVPWGDSGSGGGPVLTGEKIVVMDTWYQLTATFSSSVPADHVAIRLSPNQSWTGTMYIDNVSITAP